MNSLDNTLFIGKVSIKLDETDSTNAHAKRLLAKNKPSEGTVIFTHYQTNGRGQFGKRWESERGENLTVSIILYPNFIEPRKVFLLNYVVSLGLKDYLGSLGINVQIKWPNDIYYHDKKLGGLLIENGLTGEKLNYSIVGIGLNVNQTTFNPEIRNPTSMKLIKGKEFELELLNDLFSFIEQRYLQLRSGRWDSIIGEYTKDLYGLNEKRFYQTSRETFEGTICGVNDEGQLKMKVNRSFRYFSYNDLVYCK